MCVGELFSVLKCVLGAVYSTTGVARVHRLYGRLQDLQDGREASAKGTPGTPTGNLLNLKCLQGTHSYCSFNSHWHFRFTLFGPRPC